MRETINQLQPFQGRPRTFGQLCQHYIENELKIDQLTSARPKEALGEYTIKAGGSKTIKLEWTHPLE